MQSVTPVAGSGRLGSIPAFGLMPGLHDRQGGRPVRRGPLGVGRDPVQRPQPLTGLRAVLDDIDTGDLMTVAIGGAIAKVAP